MDWARDILGVSEVPSLTERRAMVLSYIKDYWESHHYGPTVREIQTAVPASTSTLHKILKQLKASGLVEWGVDPASGQQLARTLRAVR